LKNLILFLISALSLSVAAETAICTGKVEKIAYHQPDGFYLKLGGSGIMKICDPQTKVYRTSPESCKLIVSLATTARATDKSLQIYIDNAPGTSCSSITAWHSADVRFVELLK